MDTMREIGFIDVAACVRFGRDDVVLVLGKVKPILRAVVELEPELGASIILRNAVANTHVVHLAVVIDRALEGVAHQAAERAGQAIGTGTRPVGAEEQIKR